MNRTLSVLAVSVLLWGCQKDWDQATVPELIEALKDPDLEVRIKAVYQLRRRDRDARPAIPALIAALKDRDKYVRSMAADALRNIGPEARAAIPALMEALKDQEDLSLHSGIEALGAMGPEARAAIEPLVELMRTPKHFWHIDYFSSALIQIGPEAVPAARRPEPPSRPSGRPCRTRKRTSGNARPTR
jgi:HEAT repeat protein